jgi:hypothetical protein
MFTRFDPAQIQLLTPDDPRVTCLDDELARILDDLTSLDIALSNRDVVSQTVSETTAHGIIASVQTALLLIRRPI